MTPPEKKLKKYGTFIMEPQKWVPEDDLPFQNLDDFQVPCEVFGGVYPLLHLRISTESYMHHSCCKRWSMQVPRLLEDSRLENGDFPNEE